MTARMHVANTLVVAVSGGVDSAVLLHRLVRAGSSRLVVAHFDHGMRAGSADDRRFVQALAARYGLACEYGEGRLGPDAGEAAARYARYAFLHGVRASYGAAAVTTAHHADDVLETAIINLLRGTGRRGLSSLRDTETVRRPLLHLSKADIYDYALRHGLEWCEDGSNHHDRYLRNRARHHILPRIDRACLRARLERAAALNDAIEPLLAAALAGHCTAGGLDRHWFAALPDNVAREVMAAWLRVAGCGAYDAPGLRRLVAAARCYRPGKRTDVMRGWRMYVSRDVLAIVPPLPSKTSGKRVY